MKISRPTEEYLANFSEDPVIILPFDPALAARANMYMEEINKRLAPFKIHSVPHGSLGLGLAGKNEWEYAIYALEEDWQSKRDLLVSEFGKPRHEDEEMVMFTWKLEDGQKVELMMMGGDCALRNLAIMKYWQENESARKEYEAKKFEHTSSKRDYYRWKANYIADILERF